MTASQPNLQSSKSCPIPISLTPISTGAPRPATSTNSMRQLATDPTVAHELARSARVEAALAAHFAANRSAIALVSGTRRPGGEFPCALRTFPARQGRRPKRPAKAAHLNVGSPSRRPVKGRCTHRARQVWTCHGTVVPPPIGGGSGRRRPSCWPLGSQVRRLPGCTAASHFPAPKRLPLPSQNPEPPQPRPARPRDPHHSLSWAKRPR